MREREIERERERERERDQEDKEGTNQRSADETKTDGGEGKWQAGRAVSQWPQITDFRPAR